MKRIISMIFVLFIVACSSAEQSKMVTLEEQLAVLQQENAELKKQYETLNLEYSTLEEKYNNVNKVFLDFEKETNEKLANCEQPIDQASRILNELNYSKYIEYFDLGYYNNETLNKVNKDIDQSLVGVYYYNKKGETNTDTIYVFYPCGKYFSLYISKDTNATIVSGSFTTSQGYVSISMGIGCAGCIGGYTYKVLDSGDIEATYQFSTMAKKEYYYFRKIN